MLSQVAFVSPLLSMSLCNGRLCNMTRVWTLQPHRPSRRTGAILCVLSCCRSRRHGTSNLTLTLSSLWVPLAGLRTGPCHRLHKVVGDLPLVLEQVFHLCTVCITWTGKREHRQCQRRGEIQMKKERLHSVLTCMAWVHVYSVAIILAPTPHHIVHKVWFSHIHWGVYFHLPKDKITLRL